MLVSGASMRATATDDAPMLFAFPYGRNLKVVSHYGDWVEVTDPKSAATGWMKNAEGVADRSSGNWSFPDRGLWHAAAGGPGRLVPPPPRRLRRHDQPRARRRFLVVLPVNLS